MYRIDATKKRRVNTIVTIPVKNDADVVVGQLNGQTVKNLETKEAVLKIKTKNVTYTLPALQININNVSGAQDSIASCIKTGVVSGRGGKLVAPKEKITRAEVAVLVQRLLQKSSLI